MDQHPEHPGGKLFHYYPGRWFAFLGILTLLFQLYFGFGWSIYGLFTSCGAAMIVGIVVHWIIWPLTP